MRAPANPSPSPRCGEEPVRTARVVAALVAWCALGCAPAIPLWGGAAPTGRTDLAVGGAARVGFGAMSPDEADASAVARYVRDAQAGGVAPAAAVRHGFAEHTDLGLTVAGPLARIDVRHELVLSEATVRVALALGGGPYAGYVDGEDTGELARIGLDVPVVLVVDVVSLVSLWVGLRGGIEHGFGSLVLGAASQEASATGVRLGGILGLAFGFKNVHALLELTVAYERWDGSIGASPVAVDGLVLTPAFALRYRI